ncbi:MAG: dTMP kinase [Actinobacteria bacterium]|nr:dTMP kinase [Actinomycetota bacterium]
MDETGNDAGSGKSGKVGNALPYNTGINAAGRFISFEGIDRSGKSTQAALLAAALGERAMLVREPGGTSLAERIRAMLKDPTIPMTDRAEALLFAAARADLVERVIKPAITDGKIVIADRYVDSSFAYQGAARGLGREHIHRLNDWATDGLMPDLTLLIEIDPERAVERGAEIDDRFEAEGLRFQRAIAEAYDELATGDPNRIQRIDGDREPENVAEDVALHVAALIGEGAFA